jgi:hypothetical protein
LPGTIGARTCACQTNEGANKSANVCIPPVFFCGTVIL